MPDHPLLQLGLPPDPVAWGALVVAVGLATAAFLLGHRTRTLGAGRRRLVLVGLMALAASLSAGYVSFYLRGGPRIIDATAYFLQARALASGLMTFDLIAPTPAFRGRFLVSPPSDGTAESLGVLFPPGYPAVLALGFLGDRPLWVGPLLAALLVLATYALALRLSDDRRAALLAAALSVVSAALRYHTADTMSHGLAALLLTVGMWAALGATASPRRTHTARLLLCGLCIGWLLATRPVTGAVGAAACAWWMLRGEAGCRDGVRGRFGRLLLFGAACAPGLALLGWHQQELTGHWLGSVQIRYYALADGPPGCFGLGLGQGFGCRYEHGDVVARFGPDGFGLGWALRNTFHRLHHHALDLANWEPLWLLVPWAAWRQRRRRNVRILLAVGVGIVVAYGAFYFHGNYPGGGGRFFAELLPAEHALIAWTFAAHRWSRWLLPTALLGFACHGSFSHRHLAEREGGRPSFEPAITDRALGSGHPGALLFVDTDHGFLLGLDPALLHRLASDCPPPQSPPDNGCIPPGHVLVARWNGDATDPLLWERLGHPRAFRYHSTFGPGAESTHPRLEPVTWRTSSPPSPARAVGRTELSERPGVPRDEPLRFEAERQWPAIALGNAWIEPAFSGASCASAGRTLVLHTAREDGVPDPTVASLRGDVAVRAPGPHRVTLGLVRPPSPPPWPRVRFTLGGQSRAVDLPTEAGPCVAVDLGTFSVPGLSAPWTLEALGPASERTSLIFDYLEAIPSPVIEPVSGHLPPNPGAGSPR